MSALAIGRYLFRLPFAFHSNFLQNPELRNFSTNYHSILYLILHFTHPACRNKHLFPENPNASQDRIRARAQQDRIRAREHLPGIHVCGRVSGPHQGQSAALRTTDCSKPHCPYRLRNGMSAMCCPLGLWFSIYALSPVSPSLFDMDSCF